METREEYMIDKLSAKLIDRFVEYNLLNFSLSTGPIPYSNRIYRPDLAVTYHNKPIAIIDFKNWTTIISSTAVDRSIQQLSNLFHYIPTCQRIYIVSSSNCYKLRKYEGKSTPLTLDEIIDDITMLCLEYEKNADDGRMIAHNENSEKKKSLERKLDDVQKKLVEEQLKEDSEQDKDRLKSLDSNKKSLEAQISSLDAVNDRHKQDKEIESDWNKRIKDSFETLKSSTVQLESEKRKSNNEWNFWIGAIVVSSILLVIWYCWLISKVENQGFQANPSYLSIAPYMIPLPVYIAILWISIIQKGKARKIQLAISSLLFNVQYLESLLQLINRLSISSEAAVNNINNLIKEIIEQYIHQIGHKDLDLSLLDNIDKNENKDNPLIDKLTDIIKNITSHE